MSSSYAYASASTDTSISVKISIDGDASRRFKIPLCDLAADIFENKLRTILQIPLDADAKIERYSDSAGSYVTLDRTNMAVYKQLYRAAKAKQKLRIRITTRPHQPQLQLQPQPQPQPVDDAHSPKAVTVEDEPEEKVQAMTHNDAQELPQPEAIQGTKEEVEKPAQEELATPLASDAAIKACVHDLNRLKDKWTATTAWSRDNLPRRLPFRVNTTHLLKAHHLRANDMQETRQEQVATRATSPPIDFASTYADFHEYAEVMREARRVAAANMKASRSRAALDLPPDTFSEVFTAITGSAKSAAAEVERTESPEPLDPVEHIEDAEKTETVDQQDARSLSFTVCCNSCDNSVPDVHFHCSICDDGDFDLCQSCVTRGISCHDEGHWLIKRTIANGQIVCSNTQIVPNPAPNSTSKPTAPVIKPVQPVASSTFNLPMRPLVGAGLVENIVKFNARTCNSCVREFREEEFVHCTTCEDFDLCRTCFIKDQHGHHPKHGFVPAVKGAMSDHKVVSRLPPGRNVVHNAICDGCDKYIRGLRHKCLDCPDWDYCADCVKKAATTHANHRFVVIYEALLDRPVRTTVRATHEGITCDGPLCAHSDSPFPQYIVGERYKCAVCHDTDFCANCEASPANTHNKTHPLIKFKTPVRHVSVTTTGEHEDGKRLPTMGDRCRPSRTTTQSEKTTSSRENIAATPVQTVVDVKPTDEVKKQTAETVTPVVPVAIKKEETESTASSVAVEKKKSASETETKTAESTSSPAPVEAKKDIPEVKASPEPSALVAVFKWDTVKDGSVLPPNQTFEQTWVLRNEGTVPWPAGCSVKFVGGDYMGAVDPARPAGIRELISASESTICYNALNPGQEFPFTVLMRTPDRDGKIISYWRLTTSNGVKFGHKLWCDVTVRAPQKIEQVKTENLDVSETKAPVEDAKATTLSESRMIIPTLEHESPVVSIHSGHPEVAADTESATLAPSTDDDDEGFEDCGEPEDWADESGDSFLTDEEYDILDASDEEFLFEQQKAQPKK